MGTYENTVASTNDTRQRSISKLMKIDGIAKKTAEAMVELDIHSYADLTQYLSQHTAQEISAALKEHGVNRPPAFIDQETWTRQAELFSRLEDAYELNISNSMKIDGMATKTAEVIVGSDIHSYADLIEYLNQRIAREVSAALKEHSVNRPPVFIDQKTRIGQAKQFRQLEDATTPSPEEETEPAEKPEETPPSPESGEHDALFTVYFDVVARDEDGKPDLQTTVYDGKNADKKEVFRGSDTAPWANWILERANLPFAVEHIARPAEVTGEPPPTETEAAVLPLPKGQYGAQLEIGDVQLSVIEPTPEYLGKRLKAEISFKVSGSDAEMLTLQSPSFRIEGYIVDLESGVSKLIAFRRSQLEPQVFEYRSEQKFDIPDVGHYEFHSLVLLLPPVDVIAYHRGPTIRVNP